MTDSPSVSDAIVRFARTSAIPEAVLESARLRLVDALGVAIGARQTPPALSLIKSAPIIAGSGPARVIGGSERLSPGGAALVNGALIHILDFDDTYLKGSQHTEAAVVGAALAAIDLVDGSIETLVRGIAIGTEISCWLSQVQPGAFHKAGYLPTALLGAVAGAVAAAVVLDLDHAQFVSAIGLASNVAAGGFQLEESWAKNWNGGWAANAGVSAAIAAREGYLGPSFGLDGERGLFARHIGWNEIDAESLFPQGEWLSQSIALKRFACCHFLQSSIDAALDLAPKLDLDAVEKITMRVPPLAVIAVTPPKELWARPLNAYRARFSGHWVIARTLLERQVTLATFDDFASINPKVDALVEKTEIVTHDFENFPKNWPTRIEVLMASGETVVQHSEGEPVTIGAENRGLVTTKFRDNLAYGGVPASETERLLTLIETPGARASGLSLGAAA